MPRRAPRRAPRLAPRLAPRRAPRLVAATAWRLPLPTRHPLPMMAMAVRAATGATAVTAAILASQLRSTRQPPAPPRHHPPLPCPRDHPLPCPRESRRTPCARRWRCRRPPPPSCPPRARGDRFITGAQLFGPPSRAIPRAGSLADGSRAGRRRRMRRRAQREGQRPPLMVMVTTALSGGGYRRRPESPSRHQRLIHPAVWAEQLLQAGSQWVAFGKTRRKCRCPQTNLRVPPSPRQRRTRPAAWAVRLVQAGNRPRGHRRRSSSTFEWHVSLSE